MNEDRRLAAYVSKNKKDQVNYWYWRDNEKCSFSSRNQLVLALAAEDWYTTSKDEIPVDIYNWDVVACIFFDKITP